MEIESKHEKQDWTTLAYAKGPVYMSTKASNYIANKAKTMLNGLYGSTADAVWTDDSGVTKTVPKVVCKQGTLYMSFDDVIQLGMQLGKSGLPGIEKVIFNPPATIVMWTDGTKTVVKADGRDEFSEEYGLAMAIARKYFVSRSAFLREVANAKRCGGKKKQMKEEQTMKDSDYIFSLVGTDLPPRAVELIKSLDAEDAECTEDWCPIEPEHENDSKPVEEPVGYSEDSRTGEDETEA